MFALKIKYDNAKCFEFDSLWYFLINIDNFLIQYVLL